ncbi:hypothetical protein BGZ68_006463 [Mortierella alpina]|nr:hypothetical protein BGZ68_006463 [Mortierella alpina]
MTALQSEATPVVMLEAETLGAEEYADEVIDSRVFEQLLGLDEDIEFVKTVIKEYFEQAKQKIGEMQEAIPKKDFAKLLELGHFLKGSSAAVGIIKMKASCGRLQHYGSRLDAEGHNPITDEEALKLTEALLIQMQAENEEARNYLKRVYLNEGDEEE